MYKYIVLLILLITPLQNFANTTITASEAQSMVNQMKAILDEYAIRIKALEVENAVLREEIRKAWIQIPMSAFSGMPLSTTTNITTPPSTTIPNASSSGTQISSPTQPASGSLDVSAIRTQFGDRYAGFVARIHTEWDGIKWAYKLPESSYIGWYEFVKQWWDNHVFVDIIYDKSKAINAYDAKILYEYNTSTFQRKLIGFFEYNRTTGFYVTKSGTNPFAGVPRVFVRDPKVDSAPIPPTATAWMSQTGTTNTTTVPSTPNNIPSLADIEKAYSDKRYLSVISLSNTYLTVNPATYDLLRMRYRTFFIIGNYDDSLAEIAKIESMWQLSLVACDAQVIATYSKNTALLTKYTNACKN